MSSIECKLNQKKYIIKNIAFLAKDKPFILSNNYKISNFPMAYQTYGKLNKDKSNAIFLCHPLTADQYVTSTEEYPKHPITNKKCWWDDLVGVGKPINTNKYFVICANTIGGCMGSWGPNIINPKTGKYYGANFPTITISDMARAYKLLIDYLNIDKLHTIIGSSIGGMQALNMTILYPEIANNIILIATTSRLSAQNIAFNEIGKQAILNDDNWKNGDYLNENSFPDKGLALARMGAHITYLSESKTNKFGRNLQQDSTNSKNFQPEFQIESYLQYQGKSFANRFDANSYLYLIQAMNYFDIAEKYNGNLEEAFTNNTSDFSIISFSDDWLFPPAESKNIFRNINKAGGNVNYINITSNRGHDSLFLTNPVLNTILKQILP